MSAYSANFAPRGPLDATGQLFVDHCQAQGAGLTDSAYDILHTQSNFASTKLGYRSSAAHALGYVNWNLDTVDRLATNHIDLELLPDDPVQQVLGALINTTINGDAQQGKDLERLYTPKAGATQRLDTCATAEVFWGETLDAYNGNTEKPEEPLVHIFVDDKKQPALMRKGRGNALAINFVEIVHPAYDLVYPKGSHVNVTAATHGVTVRHDGRLILPTDANGVVVSKLKDVKGVTPGRLSAYAVEGDLRKTHYGTSPEVAALPSLNQLEDMAWELTEAHFAGRGLSGRVRNLLRRN